MSSAATKDSSDHSPFILNHSNKMNSNIENELIDKDIAVENVIRRLRQKKNIEVKKVKDVDSKLKRISLMVEKRVKSEMKDLDGTKPTVASLNNDDLKSIDRDQNIQPGNSIKPRNFLEIEDDEIEDYLEIDQNVVEDLEALIPEEEIVSISNSLIQPEEPLPVELEDKTDIETKPDNTAISKEPLSEQIPVSESVECKDVLQQNESQELELKIKKDDDVEGKSEIQQNDDLVLIDSPKDDGVEQKNEGSDEGITINNNDFGTVTNNKITSTSLNSNSETIKKIQETLENTKKQKTLYNTKKTDDKTQKMSNNKKSKQNLSGNSRKITDFFNPDSVKTESESIQQTEEIKAADNSQLEPNSKGQNCSSEIIHLEEEVIPIRTRTLRSSSKVSQVSKTKEPQEEISTTSTVSEKTQRTNNSSVVDGESKKDTFVSHKIESSIKIADDSALCEEEAKNELTTPECLNTGLKRTNESKPEISKSKRKKQSKKINKKNNSKTVQIHSQSEGADDNPEDKGLQVIKKDSPTNSDSKVLSKQQQEETVNETKDSNENHLIIDSSATGNEINPCENQQIQRKKRNKFQKKRVNSFKIQKLSTTETSNTTEEAETFKKSFSRMAEPDKSASNEIEEKQNKKRKRKISVKNQHEASVAEKISCVDHSETETMKKSDVAKLEIYDFDDKSNEEIETLKKPIKNRKPQKNQTEQRNITDVFSNKKSRLGKEIMGQDQHLPLNTSGENVELENVNNNGVNTSPNIIGSSLQSEVESPTESQEDFKPENKDNISLDFVATTPSENLSKGNAGSMEVTEEFSVNWKPSYGPYKRVDRCNVCLLAFKSYKKLRAHKKVHEVENPYKCNKCGDSFEDVEKLAAHLRIHKGKSVSDKWNNIRDTWRKSMKNKKDEKKSGSAAKKSRRYIHEEQLMFLKKVYEPRSTQESIQNCDEGNVQSGPSNATEFRKPSIPKSTKSTTDVDEKISKFLDSRMTQQKENPNLLFFKGVLPAVDSFTMDETLEFQAGVLALIQKIKGRNRVGFQRYDYQTEWQDPYRGYHTQPLQQLAAFVHSPSPTSQSSYHSQPSPAATSALQSIQQTTAFVHSPSPTSQSSYHSQPSPAATSALQSIQQTAAFVHSPSPTSQSSYHSQQSSAASSVSNYDFEGF